MKCFEVYVMDDGTYQVAECSPEPPEGGGAPFKSVQELTAALPGILDGTTPVPKEDAAAEGAEGGMMKGFGKARPAPTEAAGPSFME